MILRLPKGKRPLALKLAQSILAKLDEKEAWSITCEPVRSKRSDEQNAYLWAVPIKMLSDHTGYEPEEVHHYLCGQYWGWRDRKVPKTPRNHDGIVSEPIRTTTRNAQGKRSVLGKLEFADYVEFIQRFAAKHCSLLIPDPAPPEERERAA